MINKSSLLLFLIILFALCSENALAIGASKYTSRIEFSPNGIEEMRYTVTNENAEQVQVLLSLKGEFSQYASFRPADKFYLSPGESADFYMTITFPETFERPGIYLNRVTITEVKPNTGAMQFRPELGLRLDINVPYEGKYPYGVLAVDDSKPGQDINFKLTITNLGQETINSLFSTVRFYEGTKEISAVVTTTENNIAKDQAVELFGAFKSLNLKPGTYYADAEISYDGETKITEKTTARVGELKVSILNYTRRTEAGKTKPFFIEVESVWNDPIENTYADVTLKSNLTKLLSFKTTSEVIKPWERKNLSYFIDATGLTPGNYDIEIVLNYANEKNDTVKDSIELFKAEEPKAEKKKGISSTAAIIIAVLATIIITSAIFWLLMRQKNKPEQAQQ
jgi:hypothetical protein